MKYQIEPLAHDAKDDQEWNESYYFVFYDNKQHIGGMSRLGFKPNKNEGTVFLILFIPDGTAAFHTCIEKVVDELRKTKSIIGSMEHKRLSTGNFSYQFNDKMIFAQEPESLPKTMQNPKLIKKIANVKIDLSFKPIHEVYEYSENMTDESRQIGKKSGDKHWEQIGQVNGDITIDEISYKIENVIGQRDHTHGVRDWTGVGNWLYYVVWFNQDLCINPAAIITDDGRISSGGFLFEKGENIPLKSIRVLKQDFRPNNFPISSELEIIDAMNRVHILKGKTGPLVPMPFLDNQGNLSILTQAFGEFELNGKVGGYGSYETLRKIDRNR